eukprot:763837-Hanusia_phi.AAC.3
MKERERAGWCTVDSNSTVMCRESARRWLKLTAQNHWRLPEELVDPLPTDFSEYGKCQGLVMTWRRRQMIA